MVGGVWLRPVGCTGLPLSRRHTGHNLCPCDDFLPPSRRQTGFPSLPPPPSPPAGGGIPRPPRILSLGHADQRGGCGWGVSKASGGKGSGLAEFARSQGEGGKGGCLGLPH